MVVKKARRKKRTKLTADQVRTIITRMNAGERGNILAEEYRVNQSTISRIRKGLTWTEAPRPPVGIIRRATKLTPNDVLVIKARLLRGDKMSDIAKDHGVTGPAIGAIRDGKTWVDVELPTPKKQAPAILPERRRRVWEG